MLDARTSCPTKKHPKKTQGAREAGRVSGTPPQEEVLARCAFRIVRLRELRVARCALRVECCVLRCALRLASCVLRVARIARCALYVARCACCALRVVCCALQLL